MLGLILRLSALSIGISYATSTSCQKMQQSQLASINERINQMLSSLYTPPFLQKSQAATSSSPSSTEAPATPTYETTPYTYLGPYPTSAVAPQMIYMSPPPPVPLLAPSTPPHAESALQPADYAFPAGLSAYPRALYPVPYSYGNYPPPPYSPFVYPPPYPYPYPPVAKPNEFSYYPEYPLYPPAPGYSPVAPPPYYPPVPSPPPPYHAIPPSYPPLSSNMPNYPPIPYPKAPEFPPKYP